MVGTLERGPNTQALVKADNGLFRVKVGGYLGQNFGLVTKITGGEVVLKELVQDGTGDWAERVSSLQLQEAESKRK
jgi:type IV pilus assembly protein PilP